MTDTAETQEEQKTTAPRRVLIVMAHPDDGEFGSGGTLARWAAEGRDIYYCLITDGQAGDQGDKEITSEQLAAKRQVEAQDAADALGVQHPVIFLHYQDSRLEPTLATALRYCARDSLGEAGCGDLPGSDPLLERPGLYQPPRSPHRGRGDAGRDHPGGGHPAGVPRAGRRGAGDA